MKNARNLRIALISLPVLIIAILAIFVVPVIGQDAAKEKEPPVGLKQAEELSKMATDYIKSGEYKKAIHALHSAAFILEEGLGMHAPGQRHMCPMMPPEMRKPGMGPMDGMGPHEKLKNMDFPTALEKTRNRVRELKDMGLDPGDLPKRIEEAEKAAKAEKLDEAWEILKGIKEQMDRIFREAKEKGLIKEKPKEEPEKN